jgi:ribosomal protein S27AE
MDVDLGKFKQVMKDICPDCGQGNHLEIRSFGETFYNNRYFANEVIVCPRCGYKLSLKPERRRMSRNADTPWPDEM